MTSPSETLHASHIAALDDESLDNLGHRLTTWLASQGRVWEYLGVARFNTQPVTTEDRDDADEHGTLVWRDAAFRIHWVLIPGGELAPGCDAHRLERLRKRVLEMETDAEASSMDLERHVWPYGAGSGWNRERLVMGAPRDVEPFLLPALPLLQSTPTIERFIDTERVRLFKWRPGQNRVLAFHPDEVERVLAAMAARLPTSVEMQWAMGGGRPWLFPWGDTLPRWMWGEEFWRGDNAGDAYVRRFEEEFRYHYGSDEPEWTRSNRFGLVDPLVASCWCTVDGKIGYVGGAGECFPWQGCGEWAGFLCAAAVESAPDQHRRTAGLRPLVSLASFEP
jgi:hypothetical protein